MDQENENLEREECETPEERADHYVQVSYPPMIKKFFKEIFSEDFMKEYTNFDSFETFQYSSAVFINWNADVLCYREKIFDQFIQESTVFTTWDEMVKKASDLIVGHNEKDSSGDNKGNN